MFLYQVGLGDLITKQATTANIQDSAKVHNVYSDVVDENYKSDCLRFKGIMPQSNNRYSAAVVGDRHGNHIRAFNPIMWQNELLAALVWH